MRGCWALQTERVRWKMPQKAVWQFLKKSNPDFPFPGTSITIWEPLRCPLEGEWISNDVQTALTRDN